MLASNDMYKTTHFYKYHRYLFESKFNLKVPKFEIYDPFFFTSINPIWVGDLRTGEKKFFFSKTTADIRHFVFFTQAEPVLKICLRRLSLR